MAQSLLPGRDRGCSPLALTRRVILFDFIAGVLSACLVEMQLELFDLIAEFLDDLLQNDDLVHAS
ncbi:MAG: hypothetical protein OXF88_03145 [Rhodobacteraceae bacterium]|nr:hypothetical protein [Paracoccaceae bacterium]